MALKNARPSARRRARAVALQALYAWKLGGGDLLEGWDDCDQEFAKELVRRIRNYQLEDKGIELPRAGAPSDLRTYGIGAQILRELGVGRMRLMATPRKMPSMAGFGLEISGYADRPSG